jgi:predicted NAD/FAD-binding protein
MNIFNLIRLQDFLTVGADAYVANKWELTTVDLINMLEAPQSFKDDFVLPFIASSWTEGKFIKNTTAIAPLLFMAYGHPKQTIRNTGTGMWGVTGGTQTYIQALSQKIGLEKIKYPIDIRSIAKQGDKWVIETDAGTTKFDHLIIGTQSLQATSLLEIISSTSPQFRPLYDLLKSMDRDNDTTVDIHGDSRLMPTTNRSEWNLINLFWNGEEDTYNTIWAGEIHNNVDLFKTWTTYSKIKPQPDKLFQSVPFNHFYHTPNNFFTQTRLANYQGVDNFWFVGAWTIGIDSHENAIKAAMGVAQRLGPSHNLFELANRKLKVTSTT